MSDLAEEIETQRARTRRSPRVTRKTRRAAKRGSSRPGGIMLRCRCRWVYTGGAWRHVTPCRVHGLSGPATDLEMKFLAWSES